MSFDPSEVKPAFAHNPREPGREIPTSWRVFVSQSLRPPEAPAVANSAPDGVNEIAATCAGSASTGWPRRLPLDTSHRSTIPDHAPVASVPSGENARLWLWPIG